MVERKLVTLRVIAEIRPLEGADFIETALVDGWCVIVKKGEFAVGDDCVFFEVDSFLPEADARFAFLAKTLREWRGQRGYRLKTMKMKGQISQGLALPLKNFPEVGAAVLKVAEDCVRSFAGLIKPGDERYPDLDLDTLLNIVKWEEDVSVSLDGTSKGTFPSFIRKTDQERCVHADTVVLTEAGPMTIKALGGLSVFPRVLAQDVARGKNVYARVTACAGVKRRKRWVCIITEGGRRLSVTEDHPCYLPELGVYREAGCLLAGDVVSIAQTKTVAI